MFPSTDRVGDALVAQRPMPLRAAFADAWRGMSPSPRLIAVTLVKTHDWRPWLDDALTLLSASEAARVQRQRFAANREALALAYALHRLVLGTLLDCDPCEVPLYRDSRGCPRLAQDIAYTSLSHADGLIALAVATAAPVGIDIEPAASAARMPEICERICHASEVTAFASLEAAALGAALLQVWVRKEAVLKAAGVGLQVEMDTFSVEESGLVALPAPLSDAIHVRMLDTGNDCVAAVAGSPGVGIDFRWLRPRPGTKTAMRRPARAG